MSPTDTRREVALYLVLAYGLALTIALGLPHANVNLLLSVLVPALSVAVVSLTVVPRGHRRAWWRGLGLGSAGIGSWLPAIAVPWVLCIAAYGVAVLVGAGRLAKLDVSGAGAADLLVSLVLGTVLILGEEIGWRGFLLPRIQVLTSARSGAVVTGLLHGCFHLPLILLATTYDTEGSRWYAAPAAVLTITAAGVFYAWLRDRSGSVWPVAIAHNVANTAFDVGAAVVVARRAGSLAYVAGETGVATLGACVVLAACLLARSATWRSDRSAGASATSTSAASGR